MVLATLGDGGERGQQNVSKSEIFSTSLPQTPEDRQRWVIVCLIITFSFLPWRTGPAVWCNRISLILTSLICICKNAHKTSGLSPFLRRYFVAESSGRSPIIKTSLPLPRARPGWQEHCSLGGDASTSLAPRLVFKVVVCTTLGSYSVFLGLSHKYRRHTCYQTSVCFSLVSLSFVSSRRVLSQEFRRVEGHTGKR